MRVLVTGATGFLGSWVARELASRGHAVRVLVRPQSRLDNLRDVPCQRVVGDVTDAAAAERAVAVRDTLRWFLAHGDLEATTPALQALRGAP